MKLGKLFVGAAAAAASVGVYQNRDMVNAIFKLEKIQGDLFTRIANTGSQIQYLCKNDNQSVELFMDWVAYNGWTPANRVGEGFFFINDEGKTLTIEREAVMGGRYIVWSASNEIE
ncbi:MAG: hypothetical protein U0N74_02935 [Peptococcaceae bacterium]|mgnify:FL=1|jgi:hypothetical protein|nr:hypothetical protein [Peptococcaceae bacterium]